MEYLLLIYGDPATAPTFDSPEGQAQHAGWMRFTDEVADRTLAGAALQPATTATTVRTGQGETLTLDGPFAETKEVLGGFYLVDVPDLDAALAMAERASSIGGNAVEVRPRMTFD